MKSELRSIALYGIICLLPFAALAQNDKKYEREAEDLRKEVWAWKRPEFDVRTVPAKYSGASSVVVARRTEISVLGVGKVMLTGAYREARMKEIMRELVKLNDKSSVDAYSEISYRQMERKTGFDRSRGTRAYVGVRVIKTDGSIREINADDIVLTKDEETARDAKIAVPDLEVGDMIDYFIAWDTYMGYQDIHPYTFTIFDDIPVMHYSIRCYTGPRYAIEYRCSNGSPDFEHKQEGGGNVLEMVRKDLPVYPASGLWFSIYRQFPMIRMNILASNTLTTGIRLARQPGVVYRNQSASMFVQDHLLLVELVRQTSGSSFVSRKVAPYVKQLYEFSTNYHPDSLASEFYYALRFDKFLDLRANADLDYVKNFSAEQFLSSSFFYTLARFFQLNNRRGHIVLLSNRYGPDMKSLMSKYDLGHMVSLSDSGNLFMGVADVFSPAFHIPYYYENTPDAIRVDNRGRQKIIQIPGTDSEHNNRTEKLVISPSLSSGAVQVKRTSILRGHHKSGVQKNLILFEDYYEHERKLLGIEKPLLEDLEDTRRTKNYGEELKAAFAEARKNQKDAFEKEAEEWFATEINDLTDHQVVNLGVRHYSPDFIYSSSFSIPGLVKKAGNNFTIDVGRLQGAPLKIEESQRKRSLDVYAPYARSTHHEISIEIPAGYTVEGVANLNRKVENETGAFMAEASTVGKTVIIRVSRIFKNATEPSANWDKMLAFMDASIEWNNARLLLKKQ